MSQDCNSVPFEHKAGR